MSELAVVPEVITAQELKEALPAGVSLTVTPDLMEHINGILTDEKMQQNFRENLLSYTRVMLEGKFKSTDYVAAVHYVSQKAMGASNESAYATVWPERYKRLLEKGASAKAISSYVHAYHHSKLVKLILAQTLTPLWIVNQHHAQMAINVQAELAMTADSEKVRCDAANSLLTHLQMPQAQKVELDIAVKPDSTLADLRAATEAYVQAQQDAIKNGSTSVVEVAHATIVETVDKVD